MAETGIQTKSVMIVGVGGQGSLLASRVLGQVLQNEGYDVKISEVHGMSQRGGSVVTYVRFGDKVYSPIVCEGEADYIVSFEKIEAARYANFLKDGGTIVVNTQEIEPMPVITRQAEYPSDALEVLKGLGAKVDETDAFSLALEAGSPKAVNIVLMGKLSKYMDIDEEKWLAAIEQLVKPQFLEANKKAFLLGRR